MRVSAKQNTTKLIQLIIPKMMKSSINTPATYEAPVTFAVLIEQEHNFAATARDKGLQDMDPNELFDEDF